MSNKVKHPNYKRHEPSLKEHARLLRARGKSYGYISRECDIRKSTAHLWTKDIELTSAQQYALRQNTIIGTRNSFTLERRERQRRFAKEVLALVNRHGGKYLIDRIRDFYASNGRIPMKREFNAFAVYKARFGSWNKAIALAGFDPNPVLFAKKFLAKDGHKCDSFTEKIIDDYLFDSHIAHARNVKYAGTRMTADFAFGDRIRLEFFGLAGVQNNYDRLIACKRKTCNDQGLILIEVYPSDIFPENKLHEVINFVAAKLA